MKLSLIVAVAENHVIGNNNQLIWHLPNDLKQFRRLTTGHCIIMGRKTFDSIGKPLPNRTSVIISRNPDFKIEGCITVDSLENAIIEAQKIENEEAFIIGGAEIYRLSLPLVDKIYLTEVHHSFEGDTVFPEIDKSIWQETHREDFTTDEKHQYPYSFVELSRCFS
ncbi:dihydrofolate reductase [Arcicella aurantiaca]|uniref:Dihydrofolate reductase n=1 Tax=Arcicella aurantiaca TaxID=591202 RepID=A0A316EBZ6_9BACT|nr:dihydrofolate reductase [Arcicella aurantiaca]PWK27955.1 dihydrofolate reductase [Arcicella aurantiaca]